MTWLKTKVFFAAVALSTAAIAQDDTQQQPWEQPDQGTMDQPTDQPTATGEQASKIDVSGVVTEVDKKANTLTVVTPLPSTSITQIGDAYIVDEQSRLVAIRGQWSEDGKIMRDGKDVKLGDLKEGDVVRTSFDASTDSFGDVDAMSKSELKKEIGKEIDKVKKEGQQMQKDMWE